MWPRRRHLHPLTYEYVFRLLIIKRMRKQLKPGPFHLPFSGLGTRLDSQPSCIQGDTVWTLWVGEITLCSSSPRLGFTFMTTINCSAGFWGTRSSHSLDLSSWCLYFSHQCVSYLMLLYLAYAHNKWCHVPGRKYVPNKHMCLTNDMHLTTAVYANDIHRDFLWSKTKLLHSR